MTQKITKAFLLRRLAERFGLRRAIDEPFELSESIQPVTLVDDLARTSKLNRNVVTVVSGWNTLFTVPSTKRWYLNYMGVGDGAGSWTFNRFGIYDPVLNLTVPIDVFAAVAQSGWHGFSPSNLVVLEPNWQLRVYCTVTTSDVTDNCLIVLEEDFA